MYESKDVGVVIKWGEGGFCWSHDIVAELLMKNDNFEVRKKLYLPICSKWICGRGKLLTIVDGRYGV